MPNLAELGVVVAAGGVSIVVLTQFVGFTNVPTGEVGLRIQKYGEVGAINAEVVPGGTVWFNPWTTVIERFPTIPVTYTFTNSPDEGDSKPQGVQFSASGVTITANVSATFSYNQKELPGYWSQYRQDPNDFIRGRFRLKMRECFVEVGEQLKYTAIEVLQNQTVIASRVQSCLQKSFSPFIEMGGFTFTEPPKFPQAVQNAIDAQVASKQAAEAARNKLEQVKAENQTKLLEAQGEAKANRVRAQGLTSEVIQLRLIEKWDGKTPLSSEGVILNLPSTPAAKN